MPMRTLFFITTLFFLASIALPVQAEETPDYFPSLTAQQIPAALKQAGIENCQSLFQDYFEAAEDDPKILMKATAYDIGLCVPQDLSKAAALYEQGFKISPHFPNIPLRLALIYKFGSMDLRKDQRGDFLMKQSAISLQLFQNKQTRVSVINDLLNFQPIPPVFQKQLDWVQNTLKKSEDEKKEIAYYLIEHGFHDIHIISNELDEYPDIQ